MKNSKTIKNIQTITLAGLFLVFYLANLFYLAYFIYSLKSENKILKKDLINNNVVLANNNIALKKMEPVYKKYFPVEKAVQEVAGKSFSKAKPTPCIAASQELKQKFQLLGIETEMIVGDIDQGRHQWIGIEIEPQTGNFITTNNKYSALDLAQNYYSNMPAKGF